jgi:hypothetical protein
MKRLITVTLVLLFSVSAQALMTEFLASEGTFIKSDSPFNYTNYSGEASVCEWSAKGQDIGGLVMVKFDLSGLPPAQSVANGDGVWSNGITWASAADTPGYYGTHVILSNWTAATVTWDNWIGPSTGGAYLNFVGPLMASNTYGNMNGGSWLVGIQGCNIDQAVIQDWIDNPGDNKGVALAPITIAGRSLNQCFAGLPMVWNQPYRPRLYVDLVPEPVSVALLVSALGLLAWRRR